MTNSYLKLILATASLLGFLSSNAQSDYSVTPIPFQAYSVQTVPLGNLDDTWTSLPIPIGFDFDYFANIYSTLHIGANGVLSFDNVTDQMGGCPWAIFELTLPSQSIYIKNAIFGCYHDIDNTITPVGSIVYATVGTAPYRKFIVHYDNIAQYSCGSDYRSSFQMVLYETLNCVDSQIIQKDICTTWNNGSAIIGINDSTGTIAFAPQGRNGGQWTAYHEGWRFARPVDPDTYSYTICDDNNDGFGSFNLTVAQNGLWPANPSGVSFYASQADAASLSNPLTLTYVNSIAANEMIYANVSGNIKKVKLRVIDCSSDYDSDSVSTPEEDVNGNGNLADDDTDADGIPNFIDNDDDGDLVLTDIEYAFGDRNENSALMIDTDNDGIPNYLDNDDDNDGILTLNEDANGNHNPADDDSDGNGTPDYLQNDNLSVQSVTALDQSVSVYPNPANDVLNIDNRSGIEASSVAVYSITGRLTKAASHHLGKISVSDLQSGIYFLKIRIADQTLNYKFIKN